MSGMWGKSAAKLGGAIRRTVALGLALLALASLILSTPAFARILFQRLEVYQALNPSQLKAIAHEPAAVVILSAGRHDYAPEFGTGGAGTVDGLTLERIRYGAYVARRTHLPILVTGGIYPVPLARLMAVVLESDYALTPKWIEPNSTNTAENAIFSAKILKRNGIRRIVLVTHAWHMKRAVAAFAGNGLSVLPAPTAFYNPDPDGFWSGLDPNLGTLRMSAYAIHELVGGVWYELRYGY